MSSEQMNKSEKGTSSNLFTKLSKRLSRNSTRKASASQSGADKQTLDEGGAIKEQITQGNFGGIQEMPNEGQSSKGDPTEVKTGGGMSGSGFNKESTQVAGQQVSSSKDTSDQAQSGGIIGGSGVNKENIYQRNVQGTARRLSKGGGWNDDIKKGPIITSGLDQRNIDQQGLAGAGSSAAGGLSQEKMNQKEADAGNLDNEDIDRELATQGNIAPDVFNGGEAAAAVSSKDYASHWTSDKGTTTTQNVLSPYASGRFISTNLKGSSLKVTVLQDKVQAASKKCKTQLGLSADDISQRSPTVDAFFDTVAAERLRWMPRDSSRLDCSLRWASRLAYAVDALRESVGAFAAGANDAATLIWGFLILLLESDMDNTDIFESVFGRYGRVAVGIHLLLQYESAFKPSPDLQPEVAAVYAELLEMVCHTSASCIEGSKSKESDLVITHHVDAAFVSYARRYSTHWNCVVESATAKLVELSSQIYSSPELGSLNQFLGVQDRPLQFILESRTHSLVEGSFEWFNNIFYNFTVGRAPVMLVTGGTGSGKSALAQWTVERLQESTEHDNWNVIPYTIRADIPVATLPLRILKGILHQMLDHCVSDKDTQEAIMVEVANAAKEAFDGASDAQVEEYLWKGIRAGLASNIQFMFVVDGLDQIRSGETDATACFERFCDILAGQNAGSKMIAFSRPLGAKMLSQNLQQFTMTASQTQMDMKAYVRKMLTAETQFDSLNSDQLDFAVAVIVSRAQGSFSWAEMAVEFARQQRTLSQAISSVQKLPQAMTELLDLHLKNFDFNQQETRCIMSWLAASERPLLVEEVEQLLNVDPKGPSFLSRPIISNYEFFSSVSPLVTTRDGVVSFAHTCIRDHVMKQARAMNEKSPFDLKDAHEDLLMRCLAWYQLSVREEVDVSMDKLSMEERDRLFDKHVILEYTARYWLSHLLSSPLVTDEGEFQFSSSFKKLLPATVLFTRLELTCRESQFTRSSVVELYRLATDIRRSALGEKSIALLESLLLSARVSKLAHVLHAEEQCYEAWKLSRELLGQSHPITLTCAEMMTQSFTERRSLTAQQEGIMKYLVLTDSEITGVEFNQRLRYLGMVVGIYKSRGDNDSALLISKRFYQRILAKYGSNSRQSSETVDFLTSQFSATGNDQVSRDIARTKYDNMARTMEVTDERRIKYSLYVAQLYEQHGDIAQAQMVLSSLWTGLNSRDIDSVDMMDKKANVALVYYQFLRRQGRTQEAEVIVRELVADLEVTGIHSPEMMQRVQMLRGETREMRLYSLDRSLSVLMWRFYRENNLQYSPAAMALALSLAESIASAVAIKDASAVSGQDRKLLVELLDSITSSPRNLSVSTLILCHGLASIYAREGDWVEASDCSKAVLQHIWPSVEQPKSYQKFTAEVAPPVADIALVLAYCHFRRLHLEQANVVYDNAFGSLISADNVPVASVLAVTQVVVEFYETTFQFTNALTLLHTVSNFLESRLGQTHKHTIDNMYLEAALACRLELNYEAKSIYQQIYNATLLDDNKLAPEGIEAAIALISLYEKESQWDSALDIYRHVWPALVVEDSMRPHDRSQVEQLLEKTYLGYMAILTSRNQPSDFSERHQVASDYVQTSRNVYGPAHEKTLNATLLFAELCETSPPHTDQAIALYKQALQTNQWVHASESTRSLDQMTQPLPITLKHKLAQLFVRKRDSSVEARAMYTEELQLARKTQGVFSTTSLSWLRELALAHARQGTPNGTQQGTAILHNYVTDVLHAGGDRETMDTWARKLAAIYLECGFIDGGKSTLDELRQRVVNGPETPTAALHERRDAVFVAGFEEAFGRRATSDQILSEMEREMQTQQAFSRNLAGHDFIPALVSGDCLARLQTDQKRTRAAKITHDKLYDYFCSSLSATSIADKAVVQQFYNICLREIHTDNYNLNILSTTTTLVRDLCNSSNFQDASDLTGVLHSFLHLTDGLNNYESINIATKLCLYLSGHQATKCSDETTYQAMSLKSKLLLQEILAASKSAGIEIVDLPFQELNDIITLLGEYEMFNDLESILTQLWTSRIVQRTWTPEVVVWIGRRLVETRFCRGAVDSAIQLCRDICYNLRQVWGSCDRVTLEMTKLLSGLFTASGDHASAATLHEGALHDLLGDSDAKDDPRAADTATQHMELLRRAQSRLGMSSAASEARHADLFIQVANRFGLNSEQIQAVGKAYGGDQFGVWSRPRRFSLDVDDLDDQTQTQMHHNHLRESSGAGLLNGSGAPRRISVQAL